MRTIDVTSREQALNELLSQALEENLILRTEDGHEFVLGEIEDFDREIELTRQSDEFMRLLDARGKEEASIPLEDARAQLDIR